MCEGEDTVKKRVLVVTTRRKRLEGEGASVEALKLNTTGRSG